MGFDPVKKDISLFHFIFRFTKFLYLFRSIPFRAAAGRTTDKDVVEGAAHEKENNQHPR